jgi:hypothetical protein
MEQLDDNLLFRWFVGMDMDEPIWAPTVFSKNRDRLLNHEIARSFLQRVVERAQGLMSDEHFTVDGPLSEAWASQNRFQRKDGGPDGDGRDFRRQERKNDTHASTTAPDARLYRKSNGAESRLAYLGHVLIENRHGLIADGMATVADGYAEREAATLMVGAQWERAPGRSAPGADKAYDVGDFRRTDARAEHDAPRHAESEATGRQRDRPAHHASSRLREESACATAHRTGVRVAEDHRLDAHGETARAAKGRLALRLCELRLQSDPAAETAAQDRLMRATCLQSAVYGPHEDYRHAPPTAS